jgi:HEAT repeat protein
MDELQELQKRLATLRTLNPTSARRAEVEALLENKWEGVQVSAAQVLGEWDGPDSVPPLRSWLSQHCVVSKQRPKSVTFLGTEPDDTGLSRCSGVTPEADSYP